MRCCERACECACCKRAVDCASSTCFGLHFSNFEHVAEDVLSALTCPVVAVFRHRRGRSDRIDCRNVRKRIRDVCRSGIAINGHFFHIGKNLQIIVYKFNTRVNTHIVIVIINFKKY